MNILKRLIPVLSLILCLFCYSQKSSVPKLEVHQEVSTTTFFKSSQNFKVIPIQYNDSQFNATEDYYSLSELYFLEYELLAKANSNASLMMAAKYPCLEVTNFDESNITAPEEELKIYFKDRANYHRLQNLIGKRKETERHDFEYLPCHFAHVIREIKDTRMNMDFFLETKDLKHISLAEFDIPFAEPVFDRAITWEEFEDLRLQNKILADFGIEGMLHNISLVSYYPSKKIKYLVLLEAVGGKVLNPENYILFNYYSRSGHLIRSIHTNEGQKSVDRFYYYDDQELSYIVERHVLDSKVDNVFRYQLLQAD